MLEKRERLTLESGLVLGTEFSGYGAYVSYVNCEVYEFSIISVDVFSNYYYSAC